MNEEEKKQKLLEKLGYDELSELEDVTSVSVFGDTRFQTVEDLELLTALPGLEWLCFEELPESISDKKWIGFLEKFPALNSLMVWKGTISSDLMRGILNMKNIQELTFWDVKYDESTLKLLCWQDHLKGLDINCNIKFRETFIEVLSTLPQLESLSTVVLRSDDFSMVDFAKEHFPNIKKLNWCPSELTAEDIETMISMGLESLSLFIADLPLEYQNFEFLNRFKSLKSLALWGRESLIKIDWELPNLTDFSIDFSSDLKYIDFSGMPHLKTIHIMGSSRLENPFLDIFNLDSLKELTSFEIGKMRTSFPIMRSLGKLPNLVSLTATAPNTLKPGDIPEVVVPPGLRSLEVGIDDRVTADDIARLPVFPKLRSLTLYNVKDNGVVSEFEKKCPDLRTLRVEGKASDEDIRLFASKTKKNSISISDCSGLSPESINTIFSMKELRYITLTNAPNETLEVRDFPHLKSLELKGWKNLMEAELVNLPVLTKFPLMCPSLETLKIMELPFLKTLQLQNCPLLYYLLIHNAPRISFLNVLGSPELDLTALIRLQDLEKLELDLDQFHQDLVLETLQELPKLRNLIIDCDHQKAGQEINGYFRGGYEPVEEWKTNCQSDERERIRQALPNCEIQFGYGRRFD